MEDPGLLVNPTKYIQLLPGQQISQDKFFVTNKHWMFYGESRWGYLKSTFGEKKKQPLLPCFSFFLQFDSLSNWKADASW